MAEVPPTIKYFGDKNKAMAHKNFGLNLLRDVKLAMSFQNLKSYMMKKVFDTGCIIVATSQYGIDNIYITYPTVSPVTIVKEEKEVRREERDLVIITHTGKPLLPNEEFPYVHTVYNIEDWSIVWDIASDSMAANIPASATPEDYVSFPCPDSDLDYWRDNLTEERDVNSSFNITEFGNPVWTHPWTLPENWGVEIFPEGGEGVLCRGHEYNFWETGDFNFNYMKWDRGKVVSAMPAFPGAECYRWNMQQSKRDRSWPEYRNGEYYISMVDMYCTSPLGNFEYFIASPSVLKYQFMEDLICDPETHWDEIYCWSSGIGSLNYGFGPSQNQWGNSFPISGYYAGYSDYSHLQLYTIHNKAERWLVIGGNGQDGWEYDYREQSKFQVHAGVKYNKAGGEFTSPWSVTRSRSLENSIYDLIQEQLAHEDSAFGEDWSWFFTDDDHNPIWHGINGEGSFYTEENKVARVFKVVSQITFSISFRRELEEYEI